MRLAAKASWLRMCRAPVPKLGTSQSCGARTSVEGIPELSAGIISLLVFLLPGFVAAWVFYGLTSHPRPERFERIVEVLIFTFVVQALVPVLKWALLWTGEYVAILPWSDETKLVASLAVALVTGSAGTVCANKDIPHRWLRKYGRLTLRRSHPSEWFTAFASIQAQVTLNFKDGRRLQGWPKEWPRSHHAGHFVLQEPAWIYGDGYVELTQTETLIVPASEIESVEFMKE